MIVSMHVTYRSTGGTQGLNDVVTALGDIIPQRIAEMDTVTEYVIIRTCNRFEVYTATMDNQITAAKLDQ